MIKVLLMHTITATSLISKMMQICLFITISYTGNRESSVIVIVSVDTKESRKNIHKEKSSTSL